MSFKSFKKIVSIITVVTFIGTNAVYATPDSKSIFKNKKVNYQKISDKNDGIMRQKKAVTSGEDDKQAESQEKEAKKILSSHLEDISQIHIPQELGRITEVYNNADSKDKNPNLIVHIQDLHTNPEAELNLAKILELLLKDYNMGLVCSEGADGKVDTSLVSGFPDSQAKEKVSRIFIDSGELTGEEYLSITKYPDLPIWGIEDEKIYFQNIADFNNIMNFKTSSQVFISQAKKALEQLKPRIYSKEMMSLDQKESDYENKKIETDVYLKYLNAYIQKFNLPTADYKNISLLTETMVKEKAIDQLKIMKDYQNLFLNLQSTLQSRSLNNDLDGLIAMANLFKDQKISPFSFYSYLKDLANKHLKEGFAAKYPELDSFVDYLAKVNLLDSTKLFVEMENLSYDIKTNLARNAEEKTLVSCLRNIKFLESFFNLKVSNEELDYYLNNRDSHKVAFFEKFLKPAMAKYNISGVIDYNPDLIDRHFKELEDFYKVVKDRDVAMVNKSVSEIEKRNSRVSALIAGGFHTRGITRLLRERGYSYIVVSPYSKTDIDEENYHFLLSGKRKPLAEILSKLDTPSILKRYVKTLRVPLIFNALAEKLEAYLGVDTPSAISIRDRLIAVLQIGFGGGSVELKKSAEGILVARYNPEKGSSQYYKITAEEVVAAGPADFTGDTVYSETQRAQAAGEQTADAGRGSVWGALNTFARLGIKAGDEITVLGIQPERLKDAGKAWSESSVRREFKDAESLGIIVNTGTKDEDGREIFKVLVSLTREQLEALPADVITMLDKGRVIDEEKARIAEAINGAIGRNEKRGEEQLRPILAKLRNDKAIMQLDADVYGKPFEDVRALNPKWAEAGFDKADKKEPSRFGWTLENLKWILRNPDKIQQVLDDAKEIRAKYRYVIFCGMGGSGLSVQTVKTTFGEPENLTIYSLRTTDPAVIKDILDNIARTEGSLEEALRYTLVIPISKSGKTEETVSHKKYFENLFGKFQINIKDHMWVVTDRGSPMDTGAYTQREIQFNSKGDIGGRYTAPTTNIFLLPLALVAPEKVEVILEKARAMNEIDDIDNDTFIRLGAYLYHMAAEEGKDKVTFMVPKELQDLPMWSEQLIEESLGKGGKGFTVFYGEDISEASIRDVGKNDRVFLRINIGGKKTNDELWKRLEEKGYPVFEIDVDDIDSIGGIMLGLQRAVATVGYLWDICFVDQPAVEGYKNATREVMSKLQPGERVEVPREWKSASFGKLRLYYDRLIQVGAIAEEELEVEVQRLGATMDDAAAVYAAIINILRTKPGFEAKELTSYGRMTEGMKGILQRARTSIFTNGLKMPSKFGEGPDKNHSYHQNIEAGKDMWLSTYFMPLQIEQPEALPYDDNLIRAQTIGTVNSIVKGGRKVALITFDSTTKDAEGDVDSFFKEVERYLNRKDTINPDLAVWSGQAESFEKKRTAASQDFVNALDIIRAQDKVLEIGAGPFLWNAEAAIDRQASSVAVTDLVPWNVDRLNEKIAEKGLQDRVAARALDINQRFDFPDASFDVVISDIALLQYVDTEQAMSTLEEIRRILKPGGRLVFRVKSAEDYRYGQGEQYKKDGEAVRDVFVRYDSHVPEIAHLPRLGHFWSIETLTNILTAVGFEITGIETGKEVLYNDPQASTLITVKANVPIAQDRKFGSLGAAAASFAAGTTAVERSVAVKENILTPQEQERLRNIARIDAVITETREQAEWQAARKIADLIKSKNAEGVKIVIGFATGETYKGIYEKLIKITEEEKISWANVVTFNLDEYVWNSPGYNSTYRDQYYDSESYQVFMRTNLFTRLIQNAELKEGNIHFMNGLTDDAEKEARDYEALIMEETNGEGVDLQVLGIGVEGHIAFIEARPDMPLDDFLGLKTRVETLAPSTKGANSRFFGNNTDAVPPYAMTQGISTILKAKEILLVATGSGKSGVITETIAGKVTPEVPASVLQAHKNTAIIMDKDAAQGLVELAKSSRRQQVDSMDQIVAIDAAKVIGDKKGFENWLAEQPENIAVVIIAMSDAEYEGVKQYENIAFIKVFGRDIKGDENRLALLAMFSEFGTPELFGGFKLGAPGAIDQYKTVAAAVAEGV